MIINLLTPMMLATSPLIMDFPPNTYSHQTQTTAGIILAQSTTTATGTQHNTTMPTVGTNTGNQADGGGSPDTDLGGGDSTVADPDAD
jgi:hypothetical protein